MHRLRLLVILFFSLPISSKSQFQSLQFVENKGQWNSDYDFGTWFPGGNILLNSSGFAITVYDNASIQKRHLASHGSISEASGELYCEDVVAGHYLFLNFLGSNQSKDYSANYKSSTYYNFYLGNDPSRWKGDAHAYSQIEYRAVYQGIDLEISSQQKNLKYNFIVHPCASPDQIQLGYEGADLIGKENDDLVILTSVGRIVEKKPIAYQFIDGQKVMVPVSYKVANQKVSFDFPDGYNELFALIIDPILIFSTYSGSEADNWGSTATPGEHGTLYSSGVTNHFVGNNFSGTFPATPGAFQTAYGGLYDVAILKYDSLGHNLLYASYLGGSANDSPASLIMDKDENLIVMGTTSSFNFPTIFGVLGYSFNGGTPLTTTTVLGYPNGSDIFLTKINRAGTAIVKSTYLGGTGNDGLNNSGGPLTKNYGDEIRGDIITDDDGNIYLSSVSWSSNFPVVNSFSTSFHGGNTDAIVAKISSDMTSLLWAGYLGGSGYDASHTIKFASDGNIVVAGGTTSSNFPVTPGAYQTSYLGLGDGWVAIISADGQNILNATYTGSNSFDQVYIIDVNSNDEIYTYGQTTGSMPVTPGKYNNPNSGQFLQKFTPNLSTLEWSTVFGTGNPIPNISPTAFLVNDCEYIYMAGWGGVVNQSFGGWNSTTHGLPVSLDAFQKTTQGSDFYFIVLGNEATEFLYGTFLGGTTSAVHVDGGTSRFDKRGIVYHAVCSGCFSASSDFPTTPGAYSSTNNSINCNNAAFKFDLSLLKADFRTNTVDFSSPGTGAFCFPDAVVFENLSIGGEIFEWSLGDGTTIVKTDTTAIAHVYDQPGSYTVQLKSIDQNTCAGIDSVSKTINVYGKKSLVQDDDEVCYNTHYTLNASGGIAYTWRDSTGMIFSYDANPELDLAQSSQFTVTVLESSGCSYNDTVNISVIEPIIPDFDFKIISNCYERPYIEVVDKSLFSLGDSLYFDFGDGNTSDINEVEHKYDQDGWYTVKVVGEGKLCTYEKIVQVPIFTLKVPNVITPGLEDGKNDYLVVQFNEGTESAKSIGLQVHLSVINRWGKTVFESQDYQNDWKADNEAAGVYYYQVDIPNYANCGGWVEIVR